MFPARMDLDLRSPQSPHPLLIIVVIIWENLFIFWRPAPSPGMIIEIEQF